MTLPLICIAIIGFFAARAEWQNHVLYKDVNPKIKKDEAIVISVESVEHLSDFEKIAVSYHQDKGHKVALKDKTKTVLLA